MLIEIIHEVIDAPRKPSKYKSKPAFKPSALGTPCHRKLYYSYNRVPEDFEADLALKKYGNIGTSSHDRIQQYVRDSGVLIDYYNEKGKTPVKFGKPCKEFPIKDPDLELSALIDLVMIIEGKLWLGEVKTIGLNGMRSLTIPKTDHLIQGSTYLYAFLRALKEGAYAHIKELEGFTEVAGIVFLYECRDDGNFKEYKVTEASEVFKATLNKMAVVKSAVENGTLPGKTMDWCKSCPWRLKCGRDLQK